MNEKQALDRASARLRLNEEAHAEWNRGSAENHYRDQHDAFLGGYAAGGLAALPERFVVPDLEVLDEPLTRANATRQALAHFDSLMFTIGGDRRLAIEAALTRAMDIGAALVVQGLAGKP